MDTIVVTVITAITIGEKERSLVVIFFSSVAPGTLGCNVGDDFYL